MVHKVHTGTVTVHGKFDVVVELAADHTVLRLTVSPVRNGPSINARNLQGANLGAAIRTAKQMLTSWEPKPSDLPEVARLYREAHTAKIPTGEHVRAGLERHRGTPVTAYTARNRIQRARQEGLLPPAASTRPTLA